MRKRGRRRRKKNTNEIQIEADEVVSNGLVEIARFGKLVRVRSTGTDEQYQEFRDAAFASLPKLKRQIDDLIVELSKLLDSCDPLNLIVPISLDRCSSSVEQAANGKDREPVADIEHLISLATAKPRSGRGPAESEDIQRVFDILTELRAAIPGFYSIRRINVAPEPDDDLAFRRMSETLFVRGEEYEHIERQFLIDIFDQFSSVLRATFSFDARDLLAFYDRVELSAEQATERFFDRFQQRVRELKELHRAWVAKGELEPVVLEEGLPNPSKEIFEINLDGGVDERIVEALAHSFGDNHEFLDGAFPGWPLSKSLLPVKPIIKHDGRYFLPCVPGMFRSLRTICAALLREADPLRGQRRLSDARSEYLPRRVGELLETVFGAGNVFRNAFYEPSASERCEADVIVKRGSTLLLVECKSGQMHSSARRGAPDRLQQSLKDLVLDPHQQNLRTLDYVHARAETTFVNGRGDPLCTVIRDDVDRFFLISVTLDNLGAIGCDTDALRRAQLIANGAVAWTVSLGDLWVVLDILDRPAYFLDFLNRRIRVLNQPSVHLSDELDALMHYVENGLWFDSSSDKDRPSHLQIGNWTPKLDRYYLWQQLKTQPDKPQLAPVSKPRRKIPDQIDKLVTALERSSSPCALAAAAAILELDPSLMNSVSKNIKQLIDLVRLDGKRHSISLSIHDASADVVISHHAGYLTEDEARRFGRFRMKQGGKFVVYVVSFVVNKQSRPQPFQARCWVFRRVKESS